MAGSNLWKTIILPPIVALLIYLVSIYLLLPLYRQRTRYANYMPIALPLNISSGNRQSWIGRARERVEEVLSSFTGRNSFRRRLSQASEDSLFGDEELEEGFGTDLPGDEISGENAEVEGSRRLSRDLEVGFKDDSDEESDRTRNQDGRSQRGLLRGQ